MSTSSADSVLPCHVYLSLSCEWQCSITNDMAIVWIFLHGRDAGNKIHTSGKFGADGARCERFGKTGVGRSDKHSEQRCRHADKLKWFCSSNHKCSPKFHHFLASFFYMPLSLPANPL
jgi:hypothetical protein